MRVRAIYENGALKPLEELPIEEGTEVTVDVHPIEGGKESRGPRKSVRELGAYGLWKDRTDFKDGVDYVNKIRKHRREPDPDPK
jgi:predicted DNA-binding antitoxin AbrB/MazE fold protein